MKHENNSRMNGQRISSIRELVGAFGGTGKLADFLKVVPSAVSNWLAQKEIPRGYHLDIYLECERRGWKIDKEKVFGITDDKTRHPRRRACQPAL